VCYAKHSATKWAVADDSNWFDPEPNLVLKFSSSHMEEGELPDDYSPEHEWPDSNLDLAQSSEGSFNAKRKQGVPTFRLLVTSTSILPSPQTLAILDGYTQIQFGRDHPPAGSPDPRIRLKEMGVSKMHACAFLDEDADEGGGCWSLVDMGSMHGTFVKSALRCGSSTSVDGSKIATRLSPSRVASMPRRLHHLDEITLGSTTFSVHIHSEGLPCELCCSSEGSNEIPLFPPSRKGDAKGTLKRSRDLSEPELGVEKDPKKALTMLKRSLLTRHTKSPSQKSGPDTPNLYVDRSARRRALFPATRPDCPGVRDPMLRSHTDSPAVATTAPPPNPPPNFTSVPLPPTNIGHKLLLKQGWHPGTSLGLPRDDTDPDMFKALTEPLEVAGTNKRAGLGTPSGGTSGFMGDWREDGKRKRWDRVRVDQMG
jgi:hypothetical protein